MKSIEIEIKSKVHKPLIWLELLFKKTEFRIWELNYLKMGKKISNQKGLSYVGLQVIEGKFCISLHLDCVFLVQDDCIFLYLLDVVYFSFYYPTGRWVTTCGNWMSVWKALSHLPPVLSWIGRVNSFVNIHNYFVVCCCAVPKCH